jgi:GT2 family glycosyltransferase
MRIAFLIPTKHRHDCLARTLPAVLAAAAPVDAALLVCDQSPTPFPVPPGVRLLHRPDLGGLPAARNELLAASDADVVCFLDDDTELAPDFGLRLRELATGEPNLLAWGPVVEHRGRWTRRLHRLAQLGAFRDPRRLLAGPCDRPTWVLFGCCFAVRRAAALAVGFDARRPGYALGEDLDFFRRLAAAHAGRPVARFSTALRAVHRRDGHDRADPTARGRAKGAFLRWVARRHGGGNPLTLLHLALAALAAASGRGQEPGAAWGVWSGVAGAWHTRAKPGKKPAH